MNKWIPLKEHRFNPLKNWDWIGSAVLLLLIWLGIFILLTIN